MLARIMPYRVAGRSTHMQRTHCARGEDGMDRHVVVAAVAAILVDGEWITGTADPRTEGTAKGY